MFCKRWGKKSAAIFMTTVWLEDLGATETGGRQNRALIRSLVLLSFLRALFRFSLMSVI